MSTKTLIHGLA